MSRQRHRAGALIAALGLALGGCGPGGDALPELPLLYVGNVWGGNLAFGDEHVFFTTFYHGTEQDQAVWRLPGGGGLPTLLWHGAPGQVFGTGMAFHGGRVFWAQQDGDTAGVFSVSAGTGERFSHGKFTLPGAANANLSVADDFIFAATGGEILRIPRSGGAAEIVYTGRVQWLDRASDGGPIYFVGDGVLVRMDPTTAVISPVSLVAGASHVEIAGGNAYIAADDEVLTVPLAGGQPTTLLTGIGEVEGIIAGDGVLFIAVHQGAQHAVLRYPLGGEPSPVWHTRAVEPSMVLARGSLFLAFCCEDLGSTGGGQVVRLDF